MRIADFIWKRLFDKGLRHVFMVTGGGAMHLNDALHPDAQKAGGYELGVTCMHHEQACAMAAEGYARVAGIPAAVCVTTGPGSTNALTGVYSAFCDSIPMIVVAGQVRTDLSAGPHGLRQLGPQEAYAERMASWCTKAVVHLRGKDNVRALAEAWRVATTGRPGPVWVSVPLDVQGAEFDGEVVQLEPDAPTVAETPIPSFPLGQFERPVILAGSGIRQAGAVEAFREAAERWRIPVVLSRSALDLLPHDSPVYCGRAGTDASRAGNFVVQMADLLIIIGCRCSPQQIGYDPAAFAPRAFKLQVDIDQRELEKPGMAADAKFCGDAGEFIRQARWEPSLREAWLTRCKALLDRYPAVTPEQHEEKPLNPYAALDTLFSLLADDDIVVLANGSATMIGAQVAKPKAGQRWMFNSGCGSMGWGLPAAIGAAVAAGGKRRVICIEGDGSIMMNVQELATLEALDLNLKVFVIDNGGYSSIRQTQDRYFGRRIGQNCGDGVPFFNLVSIPHGTDGDYVNEYGTERDLRRLMERSDFGPLLVHVDVNAETTFEPRMQSRMENGRLVSPALHDMFPFLPAEEIAEVMR